MNRHVIEPKNLQHPNVSAIVAKTLPDGRGLIRALEKLGMRFLGATDEVLRWR